MRKKGFTLIELVIVVTILAILAAVAIPAFQNMQKHARDSAIKGAAAAVRTALSLYRANEIASGRPALWPDGFTSVRDVADGGTLAGHVMENGDLPDNPWARTAGVSDPDSMAWFVSCAGGLPQGTIAGGDVAWMYDGCDGRFWANTNVNGSSPCSPCTPGCQSENCF